MASRSLLPWLLCAALLALLLAHRWRLESSWRALEHAHASLFREQQRSLALRRRIESRVISSARQGGPLVAVKGGLSAREGALQGLRGLGAHTNPLGQLEYAGKSAGGGNVSGDGGGGEGGGLLSVDALLEGHRRWDWRAIVKDALQRWASIEAEQLDTAVETCNNNGTMYCQRMQIHKGKLYLTDYRAIFFDRHYAPARVMPLLAALRAHPDLPDVDIVVSGNDEPKVPAHPGDRLSWTKTCRRWPGNAIQGVQGKLPPAMFSSTNNYGVMDLPWLDFAWYLPRRPHKLRTPPWSILHPQLVAAGGLVKWEEKLSLAMHTGNVGSVYRKQLAKIAERDPDTVFVNELFMGDHAKIKHTCRELGLADKGGYQKHKCFMRFEDQCRYKFLLNTASVGYANKFKSLLLCGSVVLYVRDGMRHKEFYEYGLLPGVHYIAVDTAADVPETIRWLRRNDAYARAVATAGRERMTTLGEEELNNFVAELLTQYSQKQRFKVLPHPGSVRIECEDDLWRHYALSKTWADAYIYQDNSTCIHDIPAGAKLGPPGWGGAYRGSKPRCLASHDLGPKAQPEACAFAKPFSTSESWAAWDQFPAPHPSDKEHWVQEPCEGCHVPL